jgi:hypothetical protein
MKWILLASLGLSACAGLQRSADSGYPTRPQKVLTTYSAGDNTTGDVETTRMAYEMGFNPVTMSGDEQQQVLQRRKLRELEKTMESKQEKLQYSKVLPWLRNDEEKIELLSIPSLEGRQAWINRNNIWARARVPENRMKELIDSQDISVGMPMEYVKRAWGDPLAVEVSGNPVYKNERWKYSKNVPGSDGFHQQKRSVYFEGGRVVGWETE